MKVSLPKADVWYEPFNSSKDHEMHICFLGDYGGQHLQRWARFYADAGHEVSIVTFRPGPPFNGKVFVVPELLPGKLRYGAGIPYIRSLLRRLDPDIVHAHHITSFGLLGALSGHRPLVLTSHGSDILVSPEKSRLIRRLVAWTLLRADVVTCPSDQIRQRIVELTAGSVVPLVLQYGLDLNEWPYREPVWNVARPQLISTRNLRPIYDVTTAVSAMPEITRKYPQAMLRIYGDGPLRQELENLSLSLGVSGNVVFGGSLDQSELQSKLQHSDIYVSTSESDGLAISLLEAFATGLFPVVSDIEANRALIKPGENGLLFPVGDAERLADAVVQASRDSDLRRRAARLNRQYVEENADRRRILGELEKVYEGLIVKS